MPRRHRSDLAGRGCNQLLIANGSIVNKALTTKSTPSVARLIGGVPAGNRSNASGFCRTDQAPPQSVKSIGLKRNRPKRIDQAIAFLRRELANGEVAATRLEEKAKANGIAENTRPCPRPAQRYMSPYGLRQVRKILAVAAYNAMNDFITPRES